MDLPAVLPPLPGLCLPLLPLPLADVRQVGSAKHLGPAISHQQVLPNQTHILVSFPTLQTCKIFTQAGFSTNRPTGPIQSSSRDVRLSVCLMSPSHAIFLRGGTGACVPRPRTGVRVRRPRFHLITCMEP